MIVVIPVDIKNMFESSATKVVKSGDDPWVEYVNGACFGYGIREKRIQELLALVRAGDEEIYRIRKETERRIEDAVKVQNYRIQTLESQNEHLTKVAMKRVSLEPPAPILMCNHKGEDEK